MADQFNVQIGEVFAGDFRVVRSLNAGGMGAVYVAEQISTGKSRALKVMLPQLVADASLRKRFEQEARIASLIESEHIVEVVGAGVDSASGLPWLAMELLNGEDLGRVVETRGALPIADVLAIFEQLCHAVGAAHRVGVVHRDLKPENVFLAQAKRAGATFMVKVLDFGIAKIVAEASTKQTAAMGSPIWMAPEQADQSPVTPATDVWALGLIAFYLLTGRAFWKSANDDNTTIPQVLKEVLFDPIVPASVRAAEMARPLPPEFDVWFARCLARDPAVRFGDAAQAWTGLASTLGGLEATLGMPSVPYVPSLRIASSPPSSLGTTPAATARTGVSGSYTLAAPPSMQGRSTPPPATKIPAAGVAVVAALAVAIGTVIAGGAWWLTRGTTATVTPPSAASAAPSPDMAVVLEAKRLCDEGSCDAAHLRLAQVAPGSEARQSTELKDLERKWATESLSLADRTTDLGAKRALLEAIVEDVGVDETLRATARDRLALVDVPSSIGADGGGAKPGHAQAAVVVVAPPAGKSQSSPHAQAVVPVTPPAQPAAPVAPPPMQPPPPQQRSAYDLANSAVSADWWTARAMLEPKVTGGTATVEEIRLLNQICKNQRDGRCLKACKKALSMSGR